ncbi:MAG: hypothetical protein LBC02_14860, partial [Planctomycetaceae bacterium]|nr:hypothetical protein [Planctomycetaceae bacterium]
VIRTQDETGYWKLDWFTSISSYEYPYDKPHIWTPTDDQESRLLATSHLIEWMLELPEDFEVPDSTLVRGGRWMLNHLKTKKYEENTPICPYAHVVRDLELLAL